MHPKNAVKDKIKSLLFLIIKDLKNKKNGYKIPSGLSRNKQIDLIKTFLFCKDKFDFSSGEIKNNKVAQKKIFSIPLVAWNVNDAEHAIKLAPIIFLKKLLLGFISKI